MSIEKHPEAIEKLESHVEEEQELLYMLRDMHTAQKNILLALREIPDLAPKAEMLITSAESYNQSAEIDWIDLINSANSRTIVISPKTETHAEEKEEKPTKDTKEAIKAIEAFIRGE